MARKMSKYDKLARRVDYLLTALDNLGNGGPLEKCDTDVSGADVLDVLNQELPGLRKLLPTLEGTN